jgi:circadian clock protein KaiB
MIMVKKRLEIGDQPNSSVKFVFTLYVAGPHPQSLRAVNNIKDILKVVSVPYELKVIDIYDQPSMAREDQIFAAPTLVKKFPLPLKKFIGDLSDKQKVLAHLGVHDYAKNE